ncbi:ribosome-recycling factor [Candidatus Tremblaya phenacola]|uniref:Ribosome-recycling factor n=1 Tax=Candidatus Tremblayella phenacoccinincola TaxID=1010676 RepID=A0A2G0V798_9PROT|nr:ribosome recycling factor [Candidatus Tremblaya phenacola]PHN16323.1 Ribosome-recycling factor [Candidatus Tremblaya phenacola]
MNTNICKDYELQAGKYIDSFIRTINSYRTGKASPDLLNGIKIMYNNKLTSIRQLATISLESTKSVIITAFDNSLNPIINKSIIAANLGLVPYLETNLIRILFPDLSETYRYSLVKLVHNEAEKVRVTIRNTRRMFNNKLKDLFKKKLLSKDNMEAFQIKIQTITDCLIKKVNNIALSKEAEMLSL